MKRLYKSTTNKMLTGVAGGLAEYAGIDPSIMRLIFVALTFVGSLGLVLYIVAAIILPTDIEVQ